VTDVSWSVSWSRCGGQDCVRLTGVPAGSDVLVRPATALGDLPPAAGRVVADGGDLCFLPRFAFLDGTTYAVAVDGVLVADLVRQRPARAATTEVLAIYPTAAEVPLNLLRYYVWFSAPMSEGFAAGHVHLAGDALPGAFLPTEHELWDAARRRLTVLLDPARIKRGLVGHRETGYPLRSGTSIRLVVDSGFLDAAGDPLRAGAERSYRVGDQERRMVEPRDWALTVPAPGTSASLGVAFGRPLDHGLLGRCLRVLGPDDQPVDGGRSVGAGEASWRFTPSRPWAPGVHHLVVDPVLEDVAGNSVSRVFDRDLTHRADDAREALPVRLPFRPGRTTTMG
jgi:hypothetical protein